MASKKASYRVHKGCARVGQKDEEAQESAVPAASCPVSSCAESFEISGGLWVLSSVYIPMILYLVFVRNWKLIAVLIYLWDSLRRIFCSVVCKHYTAPKNGRTVAEVVAEFAVLHPLWALYGIMAAWTVSALFALDTISASSDWLLAIQGLMFVVIAWPARYRIGYYISGILLLVLMVSMFFWNGSKDGGLYIIWGVTHVYIYLCFAYNVFASWNWQGIAAVAVYSAFVGAIKGLSGSGI